MKSGKLCVLVPAALALIALCGKEAAAQAPTVTAAVNGAIVTVQWNSVPGATGYDILVSGALSGSVNVPASVTFFQVTPPAGTYGIQVRGTAGSVQGPLSNVVTVTVGGSAPSPTPCAPPPATAVNVSTSGTLVSVTWDPVAGAMGYRAEFSRFPGGTELAHTVGPGQTSLQGHSPFLGTFYVRVAAGNGCGISTSPEVAFTVGTAPAPGPGPGPAGPRTPDPLPGQLLPAPGYGAAVVDDVAARFRGDLANACGSRTFLYRVVHELRRRDTRWGLNYKRGQRGSLSTDIVTFNPTNRPDDLESQVYLFDVIGAICEGNYASWGDATHDTWAAGQSGNPACGTPYCAMWTLDPYLAAGFPLYPQ